VADPASYDFFLYFDEPERERAVADLRADGWHVETSPTVDPRVVIVSCLVRAHDERRLDEAVSKLASSMGGSYQGFAPSSVPRGMLRRREPG
jgi:hypothetical protein